MTILEPRRVPLGGLRAMTVRRTLPQLGRTTIGAWCFVDHFGPDPVEATGGMSIGPHPHTGLQTVTWLFEGEVEHRDSVGSLQRIHPGQVNLMTAGRGISHAENSTPATNVLHGVQLWVALPDEHRRVAPFFEHHTAPRATFGPATVTTFVGRIGHQEAPTTTFTPLVGAEVWLPRDSEIHLPVDPSFEHGILVDTGSPIVDGRLTAKDHLAYVAPGVERITLTSGNLDARLILIGGLPFDEQLVMWWNFIGRTHEEIEDFRAQWQGDVVAGGTPDGPFGHVDGGGAIIPAPEMPNVRLRPRS